MYVSCIVCFRHIYSVRHKLSAPRIMINPYVPSLLEHSCIGWLNLTVHIIWLDLKKQSIIFLHDSIPILTYLNL